MLCKLTENEFDEAYRIMRDSFPTDEIRPYTQQKALLSNPIYKLLGLIGRKNNTLKAIAAIYELDNILFLEHLAVSAQYRNQGLGAQILAQLQQCRQMLCLEAELPATKIAARRIDFYKRNGLYYNDFPYVQPPLALAQSPVDLRIMTSQKSLNSAEFLQIRTLLYKKVYNCQNFL